MSPHRQPIAGAVASVAAASVLPPPPAGASGWPWSAPSGQPPTSPDLPRITVVTANLNYGRFLEGTIRSVLLQGYPNLEYIVVDGGSVDESLAVIEKYRSHLAEVLVGPDAGPADAINKGIRHGTGEVFNWINSDDLLSPGALLAVGRAIAGHDAVAGVCVNFDHAGAVERVVLRRLTASRMMRRAPGTVFHQPAFWPRLEHVREAGCLPTDLRYTWDAECVIRLLAAHPRVCYLDAELARFRVHPDSITSHHSTLAAAELEIILARLEAEASYPLRSRAARALRRRQWWRRLAELGEAATGPGQAARIVAEVARDPGARLGRATLRAILRSLAGRRGGGA